MPVYNSQKYLREAIDSILSQTFSNFELIIIDDGSNDNSKKIIKSYKDKRVKLIENDRNMGIGFSLNLAIKNSSGEFIARMDADDISISKRLQLQYDFLKKNKSFGICGSWYKNFGSSHKLHKTIPFPDYIKCYLLFDCVMGHSTVMIRKSVLSDNNLLYDEKFRKSQDFDLWVKLSYLTKFHNIPKVLLKYRVHSKQIGSLRNSFYSDKTRKKQSQNIIKNLEIKNTKNREQKILFDLEKKLNRNDFEKLQKWIEFLLIQNEKIGYYKPKIFAEVLLNRFWRICKNYERWGARFFFKSYLHKYSKMSLERKIKSFFYGLLPIKSSKKKF